MITREVVDRHRLALAELGQRAAHLGAYASLTAARAAVLVDAYAVAAALAGVSANANASLLPGHALLLVALLEEPERAFTTALLLETTPALVIARALEYTVLDWRLN